MVLAGIREYSVEQKEIIDFWATEAEESLDVAKHLFEKKDYSLE